MTLEEFCLETHNWFTNGISYGGEYTIADNTITLSQLKPGQYFRIYGSTFNDGVHQYPCNTLIDETFDGIIYPMRVPAAVLETIDAITAWQNDPANVEAQNGPYQSESFAGYSYTKATATSASGAVLTGWRAIFNDRLKPWRKLA